MPNDDDDDDDDDDDVPQQMHVIQLIKIIKTPCLGTGLPSSGSFRCSNIFFCIVNQQMHN